MRKGTRLGTERPAHYRLWQHTKHDLGCPLDPTAVIEHIAHGSHGLATVDEQGILRLNLPEKLTDILSLGRVVQSSGYSAIPRQPHAQLPRSTVARGRTVPWYDVRPRSDHQTPTAP
ncbi:hypothetical protein GCM10010219_59630 [Streptomyces netropsis]|nr:hypothetical protein GCM10010219_59630 [Streptomyces netropsis]